MYSCVATSVLQENWSEESNSSYLSKPQEYELTLFVGLQLFPFFFTSHYEHNNLLVFLSWDYNNFYMVHNYKHTFVLEISKNCENNNFWKVDLLHLTWFTFSESDAKNNWATETRKNFLVPVFGRSITPG